MMRIALLLVLLPAPPTLGAEGIPVIYSTDLYHPHDDPDDHYDLATLFALPELDVRGVIIDMSNIGQIRDNQKSVKKPGRVAVDQLMHLTGRQVPVVLGLDQPLRSLDDRGDGQAASVQAGVRMILSTLRSSTEKVNLFTTGSLRDVAAAYNRDPQLMRSKIKALYINAGTGPDRYQEEWNVHLDSIAYRRVLLSDLPIRWYPCFGRDGYRTYFRVDQTEILGDCPAALRAFFDYALSHSQQPPIEYLRKARPAPTGPRNMWCTPSFLDLVGRKIYRTDRGYEALTTPPGGAARPVTCYELVPVALTESSGPAEAGAAAGNAAAIDAKPHSDPVPGSPWFEADLHAQDANIRVIRVREPEYTEVMTSCLKNLLESFPVPAGW